MSTTPDKNEPTRSPGTEAVTDPLPGEMSHGGQQGEALYGYGRNGGSIADTGTRTDVPVGVEQVESSALSDPSSQTARERQDDPPRGRENDRGETDTKLGVQDGDPSARTRRT